MKADKLQSLLQFVLDYVGYSCVLVLLLGVVCLIIVDAVKAFNKRAHWIPAKALVLSALTIQVFNFLTSSNFSFSDEPDPESLVYILNTQMLIDGGRLCTCVFMGYLLPAMATPSSAKDLRTIAALVVTLFAAITSELYIVIKTINRLNNGLWEEVPTGRSALFWYLLSQNIFFISSIFLVLALCCTVIAGKTVSGILAGRISVILLAAREQEFRDSTTVAGISTDGDLEFERVADGRSAKRSWNDFEDEVFKSWLMARASQPDYVMARSVLSSATGFVVSICILIFCVKIVWMTQHSLYQGLQYEFTFSPTEISLLLSEVCSTWGFILLGWVVICWRWVSTVFYFPKLATGTSSYKTWFSVENFWTSGVIDFIHTYDIKNSHFNPQSNSNDLISLLTKIVAKLRLHKLLYVVWLLQIVVVLISKICQLVSEIVLVKIVMGCWLLGPHHSQEPAFVQSSSARRYEDYADILGRLCMRGEDPVYLWKANQGSINQVQVFMKKGQDTGEECHNLISSNPFSVECIEEGLKNMNRLKIESLYQVKKYFPNLDQPCFKMTALSLLNIIIQLHGAKSDPVRGAVENCCEVWDLMNFVDSADMDLNTEAHQISLAADMEFSKLKELYEKLPLDSHSKVQNIGSASARESVQKLSTKAAVLLKRHKILTEGSAPAKKKAGLEDPELHDAIDWMHIAPQYSLYKLLKVMEVDTMVDLGDWAERLLRNIIAYCLSSLPDLLLKYCQKSAQKFEEDNLWSAIYLAGKTRGIMEKCGLQPIVKAKHLEQEMEWALELTSTVPAGDSSSTN